MQGVGKETREGFICEIVTLGVQAHVKCENTNGKHTVFTLNFSIIRVVIVHLQKQKNQRKIKT